MRFGRAVFIFTTVLAAGPSIGQSVHDAHPVHSNVATKAEPAATPAKRWATDVPLRAGMRRIRQGVQALGHYEHGHMDATQARNIAGNIDEAVRSIIAACKLEPEADGALHGLLVKFIAGAKAVRESDGAPSVAIADMRSALERYPQLFEDPDWNAPSD